MTNTKRNARKFTASLGILGSHIAEANGWEAARAYRMYLAAMVNNVGASVGPKGELVD